MLILGRLVACIQLVCILRVGECDFCELTPGVCDQLCSPLRSLVLSAPGVSPGRGNAPPPHAWHRFPRPGMQGPRYPPKLRSHRAPPEEPAPTGGERDRGTHRQAPGCPAWGTKSDFAPRTIRWEENRGWVQNFSPKKKSKKKKIKRLVLQELATSAIALKRDKAALKKPNIIHSFTRDMDST